MKKYINKLFASGLLFVCSAVHAGGYQLQEYSVTGLGRAFAGQGVVGDDYSALAFNPAGMSLMKKSGFQTGVTLVNLKTNVKELNPPHRNTHMKVYAPVPHIFAQYKINDRVDVGFGIYAPYGLSTRYKHDSFVSDMARFSELEMIDFSPAISYKLNQHWSIGAAAIVRYIRGHMTSNINSDPRVGGGYTDYDLDGWAVTGSLGVLYQPTENTRFGVAYHARSTQQAKGDHKTWGNQGPHAAVMNGTYIGRASPDLPQFITFSGYHRINNFGLSATAKWTDWTRSFKRFTLESENPVIGERSSPYKWKSSWTLLGGLDYYYSPNWTFRIGGGWDESPSHNANRRTIRIPDNDRFWAACGLSYIMDTWQIDVGYAHMFGRTATAYEPDTLGQTRAVKFKKLRANIYALQFQYKF